MKNIGGLVVSSAALAAAVGSAIAYFSRRVAPDYGSIAVLIDGLVTAAIVTAASVWAVKTRPAPADPMDTDADHRPQGTRLPHALAAAFLTMLAAACAGHFHVHLQFGYLLGAFLLGIVATLTALFADFDRSMPPLALMIVFMGESMVVFLATAAT